MDLQELRCFQQVARLGSISRASVQLGLAQPSLTRQIQRLEDELGARLFYRNGRGVTLTHIGQRLLDGASDLLADVARLRQDIADQANAIGGEVSVGMPPSFCAAIGADLVTRFAQCCPQARLRLHEHFSASLLELVCASRLDLAVLYDVRRAPGLLVTPLLREHLFLVAGPTVALPDGTDALAAIARMPLIMPCAGNGLRMVVEAAMAGRAAFAPIMEIDSIAVIKHLVASGSGVTILPFGAVQREVGEGRLQARLLDPGVFGATLVTATPAHQPVTNTTRLLSDMLARCVGQCVADGILRGIPLSGKSSP